MEPLTHGCQIALPRLHCEMGERAKGQGAVKWRLARGHWRALPTLAALLAPRREGKETNNNCSTPVKITLPQLLSCRGAGSPPVAHLGREPPVTLVSIPNKYSTSPSVSGSTVEPEPPLTPSAPLSGTTQACKFSPCITQILHFLHSAPAASASRPPFTFQSSRMKLDLAERSTRLTTSTLSIQDIISVSISSSLSLAEFNYFN